ncbi:MAG: HEAT repeat domain-containing protein [Alphaproteobacteria bacterium]|nr:HEAT repeat domain-containing protein [Alphaproteobacteria bacterium]
MKPILQYRNRYLDKCISVILLTAIIVLSSAVPSQAQDRSKSPLDALLERVTSNDKTLVGSGYLRSRVDDLGSQVEQAISVLREHLNSPESLTRVGAAVSLGLIGSKASVSVPDLIVLLKDESPAVRYAAAGALRQFGPLAKQSGPALIEALVDPGDRVGFTAGGALFQVDKSLAIATIRNFAAQVYEGDPDAQRLAAISLGNLAYGPYGSFERSKFVFALAWVELESALNDDEAQVRAAAATALKQIANKLRGGVNMHPARRQIPVSTVVALKNALSDETPEVRRAAANALSEVGKAFEGTVSTLIPMLVDPKAEVRAAAASSLGRLGDTRFSNTPGAHEAITPLIEIQNDPDARVRAAVAGALGTIRVLHPDIAPALALALQDENADVRRTAARSFRDMAQPVISDHSPVDRNPEHPQNKRRVEARRMTPALIQALETTTNLSALWLHGFF